MSEEISNEQLFEFMTKMYGEMQGMKENMATKDDLANTNQAIVKTNQAIVRLENKMDENHKALHDGYKLTYEKLNIIEEKVDQHDVEIRVIKTAK